MIGVEVPESHTASIAPHMVTEKKNSMTTFHTTAMELSC
jgi:hypothetical protein